MEGQKDLETESDGRKEKKISNEVYCSNSNTLILLRKRVNVI